MAARLRFRVALRALAPLALALAALAACGGGDGAGEAVAALPPVVAPGTWVVMGSSSAAGAGATEPGRSWVARLQADYAARSVSVANLAKGGTTTYAGLPAASRQVPGRPPPDPDGNVDAALARAPKLLLVSYPTNDTALGYSVEETVSNLLAIRAAAVAGGAGVIVLSTQPRAMITSELARLPQIDARLAQAVGPCFVAVREALATPSGQIDERYSAGDGVHVNDAGHALILERVRAVIDGGQCVRLAP
jgi:lysophospholipase L1-like esterase